MFSSKGKKTVIFACFKKPKIHLILLCSTSRNCSYNTKHLITTSLCLYSLKLNKHNLYLKLNNKKKKKLPQATIINLFEQDNTNNKNQKIETKSKSVLQKNKPKWYCFGENKILK
ncbi:hypothetical protein RFI_09524 [Reticulomyxa filosa]|uniref:Uncharacterized protein n=1 Tax=Reticulomyxa filosa TaxID=46433 RepID=X6NPI5_RETFI|nr:hypothetical protein RFI_09524 [Reticulomyxa filosa]|eukprot:ETO27609.1 hypothetical protein RFI_09524 [Reticulomyxa filosa]